jgi:hypothetical protein
MDSIKNLKDFVRNPLGIVALFISLIYGFASLLLGSAAEKLEAPERWPLVGFVVVFPFVVLHVFYKLVTEHHGKLYGPGDYKTDEAFLKTLTSEERTKKLLEDVEEVIGSSIPETETASAKANTEIKIEKVKDKIIRAEKFVINKLAAELNIKPITNIKVSPKGYVFDAGYLAPNQRATLLEVKYLTRPTVAAKVVQELVYRSKLVAEYMDIDTRFVVALVVDFEIEKADLVRDIWAKSLSDSGLNYEIRIYPASEAFA